MNMYMTTGTYAFLKKMQEKHPHQCLVLLENPSEALLLHETSQKTIFQQPRKYEIIDAKGKIDCLEYVVFNHIPVKDEGRPVFEYHLKGVSDSIQREPGFQAFRLLRPLKHDTYIIMTGWESEIAFRHWTNTPSFQAAYGNKQQLAPGENKHIMAGASYFSYYAAPKEEDNETENLNT
ncbi:antibiotic biosynthesis monooxygenase family protein [Bacillus chungangensis]|uniref:Heme-degrading monooxygenase HmoA n=1 Tax=Bacillus chungangensis TaxID=587633 RepID=A0ABT9WNI5_9BACI|nr:antibiotic biosynthesis monooxygenase [Bacillus chungangensis]MDQ0174777.1 heme-degrading monooxygenase HmoA [Bacillus chungangensis]